MFWGFVLFVFFFCQRQLATTWAETSGKSGFPVGSVYYSSLYSVRLVLRVRKHAIKTIRFFFMYPVCPVRFFFFFLLIRRFCRVISLHTERWLASFSKSIPRILPASWRACIVLPFKVGRKGECMFRHHTVVTRYSLFVLVPAVENWGELQSYNVYILWLEQQKHKQANWSHVKQVCKCYDCSCLNPPQHQ